MIPPATTNVAPIHVFKDTFSPKKSKAKTIHE
jgi:hypothetical protein